MFHLVMKCTEASTDSRIYPAQSMTQQLYDGLPAIFPKDILYIRTSQRIVQQRVLDVVGHVTITLLHIYC